MAIQEMPIGYDSFEMVRQNDCYYVDKTLLIKRLVKKKAWVTLITRPRRFGKSLNMSMLDCFFDVTRNNTDELFRGLKIENEPEYSERHKFPTIFLSFKDVKDNSFSGALSLLKDVFSDFCDKHLDWLEDSFLNEYEKQYFNALHFKTVSENDLKSAIFMLTRMAYKKHGTKVVLLIDEYDVPLAQGDSKGYYDDIINVMSTLYSKALKGNEFLQFAVVTGCLRIAKESIFTGLNNFSVYSITDPLYDECFGFTDQEVDDLLTYTNLTQVKPIVKEWYDGYRFGDTEIYCPWDVLNYVSRLMDDPDSEPQNFWANTSGNDIIKKFINADKIDVTDDFETLMNGGTVRKPILEDIVYSELTKAEANFWTVLYLTGYLTSVPDTVKPLRNNKPKSDPINGRFMNLKIPNKEISILFMSTVNEWFTEKMTFADRSPLINAIWEADSDKIESIVTEILYDTISYFDSYEYYYHGFMAGLLVGVRGCRVVSNRESGDGRSDINFIQKSKRRVAIIEIKRTDDESKLSVLCDKGLKQIDDEKYAYPFEKQKMSIIKIGMAFCGKECMVKVKK